MTKKVIVSATGEETVTDVPDGLVNAVPGPATHFALVHVPGVLHNVPLEVTVIALDEANVIAAFYTGKVHFDSSDRAAKLPTDAPLANGVGVFSLTLESEGSQVISVTDTADGSINGNTNVIVENDAPIHVDGTLTEKDIKSKDAQGVRRLHVSRIYQGAKTSENAIIPGVYYEDDAFLFGLAEWLVTNAYAEWVA
jgi:hypothetical protein